ncbi:MAG: alpha/beta hydrolase [Gammaproteobacteria bacterium]|nr:alpha/beta hydrolase [Gammaproteobacteria bacterium]
MPTAHVNGIALHFEDSGQGIPVLFIHGGYGGPATTLVEPTLPPIVSALQGVARVITYDRRSAGRSQYVLDAYTMGDIATDAAALIDYLEIERCIVVGSSAGGPIAIQFALNWPERLLGLALPNTGPALMCEAPSGFDEPLPEGVALRKRRIRHFLDQVEDAARLGDKAYFETHEEDIRNPRMPPGASATPNDTTRRIQQALAAASSDVLFECYIGMLRNYSAYIDVDFTAALDQVHTPTFIVHGTADRVVPIEYAQVLQQRIPQTEYHAIDGAGHGILFNIPAQRRLARWVAALIQP